MSTEPSLLDIIDGRLTRKKEHHTYYNSLIPLLIAKDPKAQELFTQVCSKSEGAVKCIQRHVKKLEDNKKDPEQLECLKGLIADFKIKESKEKGKKLYKVAKAIWDINPHDAICALREAVECDYWKAQEKLEELKKSKGYKSQTSSKNDHGAILKKIEVQKGKEFYEYFELCIQSAGRKNIQLSEEEIMKASVALFKAVTLGDRKAKVQEKKIKNSQGYKDAKNGIDKTYTDPLSKLGKEYYIREDLNSTIKAERASQLKIPQPAPSLPGQNIISSVQEQSSVNSDMKGKNSKEVRENKRKGKESPSKQEEQVTIESTQNDPSQDPATALKDLCSTLESLCESPFPKSVTDQVEAAILLLQSNAQEPEEKKEAITTEVPILTDSTFTKIIPSEGSDFLLEKKKPRIKKTLEISKKEKKQLPRTNSKKELGSFSSPSEETFPEHPTLSKSSKAPLLRTVSLNAFPKSKPSENPRGSTPKIERRNSLSQIEVPPHFGERTTTSKEKKSKTPFTKETIKQHFKRRKSDNKSKLLESQKESEKASPVIDTTVAPEVSYRKLTRSLSGRDLKRKSDVPLTPAIIITTLENLKSQGIIDYHKNDNTISATKIGDPTVHITLHAHSDSDTEWFKKPECVNHFLWFMSECDPNLGQSIHNIGKSEPK